MAITNTINRTHVRNSVVGQSVASGTVAAEDVILGFKPRYVKVFSLTERVALEWYEGMTAGHALKTVAAGTRTHITSLGITIKDDSDGQGFTIGADTALRPNTQAFTLQWEAFE